MIQSYIQQFVNDGQDGEQSKSRFYHQKSMSTLKINAHLDDVVRSGAIVRK